jgi:hypothetical protein
MALDTYSNIKTAVGTWLARDDLTSYVADLMTAAEYRIYRELRVRQMETAYSGTISSGVIALPSGFKGWKTLRIASSPAQILQATDLDSLMRQYPTRSSDGKPAVYAINGSNVEFGPYPDDGYSVAGTYWKQLTALSASNESNWLVTDAPELLLWASLSEAAPFLKDDARIAVWEGKYQAARAMLESESRSEAGSGLSMRAA